MVVTTVVCLVALWPSYDNAVGLAVQVGVSAGMLNAGALGRLPAAPAGAAAARRDADAQPARPAHRAVQPPLPRRAGPPHVAPGPPRRHPRRGDGARPRPLQAAQRRARPRRRRRRPAGGRRLADRHRPPHRRARPHRRRGARRARPGRRPRRGGAAGRAPAHRRRQQPHGRRARGDRLDRHRADPAGRRRGRDRRAVAAGRPRRRRDVRGQAAGPRPGGVDVGAPGPRAAAPTRPPPGRARPPATSPDDGRPAEGPARAVGRGRIFCFAGAHDAGRAGPDPGRPAAAARAGRRPRPVADPAPARRPARAHGPRRHRPLAGRRPRVQRGPGAGHPAAGDLAVGPAAHDPRPAPQRRRRHRGGGLPLPGRPVPAGLVARRGTRRCRRRRRSGRRCAASSSRPRRAGSAIDVSESFALADGLSHTEHRLLAEALGPWAERLVPAEDLAVGWLETRLPEEIAALHGLNRLVARGHRRGLLPRRHRRRDDDRARRGLVVPPALPRPGRRAVVPAERGAAAGRRPAVGRARCRRSGTTPSSRPATWCTATSG